MVRATRHPRQIASPNALGCVLAILAAGLVMASGAEIPRETVRYVRPAGDKFATECQFVIAHNDAGWTITSTTDRGPLRMEVATRYDADDQPLAAKAVLTTGGKTQTTTVEVKAG